MYPTHSQIKVLCFFRYWVRERGRTREYQDGVMISVEKLARVYDNFQAKMRSHINRWGYGWVGPRPHAYELIGWISENGILVRHKPGTAIH